jgi:hypothetical protein
MRLRLPLVLNVVLMLCLSGCQRKSGVEENAPLVDAGYETYTCCVEDHAPVVEAGYETYRSVEENAPLVDAAYETYILHVRAMRGYGGEKPTPDDIPMRCWSEGIKKLKPIKVYKHKNNIVVVQKVRDNVEEGKYIHIPISSNLPMDGIDGFTLHPNPIKGNRYLPGDGIFDYQRTIKY